MEHSPISRRYFPNTGKYGPEKTPYLDTFHAVYVFYGFLWIIWKPVTLYNKLTRFCLECGSIGGLELDVKLEQKTLIYFKNISKFKFELTSRYRCTFAHKASSDSLP